MKIILSIAFGDFIKMMLIVAICLVLVPFAAVAEYLGVINND
jgi:hypothetical protein